MNEKEIINITENKSETNEVIFESNTIYKAELIDELFLKEKKGQKFCIFIFSFIIIITMVMYFIISSLFAYITAFFLPLLLIFIFSYLNVDKNKIEFKRATLNTNQHIVVCTDKIITETSREGHYSKDVYHWNDVKSIIETKNCLFIQLIATLVIIIDKNSVSDEESLSLFKNILFKNCKIYNGTMITKNVELSEFEYKEINGKALYTKSEAMNRVSLSVLINLFNCLIGLYYYFTNESFNNMFVFGIIPLVSIVYLSCIINKCFKKKDIISQIVVCAIILIFVIIISVI